MTVADTSRKAGPFDGNGVTTSFPFDFKVFAKTDVRVIRSDLIGVEADLVLDSDYTVNLNVDQDATPGGTVSYVGPPILPTGWKLVILGSIPTNQVTDITNVGRFNPDVIERTMDRTTVQIQQLEESITRAVQVPPTSSVDPKDLLQSLTIQANEVFAARDQVVEISIHFSDEADARLDAIQAEGDAILDVFTVDGNARLSQFSADAASQLSTNAAAALAQRTDITNDANAMLAALGYQVPVAYGAGLPMTSPSQTVSYNGDTYAPIKSELPFTTSGVFEVTKFRLIQGVSGADLAASFGSNMVGFLQAGIGAVPWLLQDALRQRVSFLDYMTLAERADAKTGAPALDHTASMQAAIDANKGKQIVGPAGYVFHAAGLTLDGPTYNGTEVVFEGEFLLKQRPTSGSTTYQGAWVGLLFKDLYRASLTFNGNGQRAVQPDEEHVYLVGLAGVKNMSIPRFKGREVRGDGLYISQSDWTATSSNTDGLTIGVFEITNAAADGRNGLSLVSGDNITISSFLSTNVGAVVGGVRQPGGFDIEPNHNGQSCKNIAVAEIQVVTTGTTGLAIHGRLGADVTRNVKIGSVNVVNACPPTVVDGLGNLTQTQNFTLKVVSCADVSIASFMGQFTNAYGDGMSLGDSSRLYVRGAVRHVREGVRIGNDALDDSGGGAGVVDSYIDVSPTDVSRFGIRTGKIIRTKVTGKATAPVSGYYTSIFGVISFTHSQQNCEYSVSVAESATWTRSYRNDSTTPATYSNTVIRDCDLSGSTWAGFTNQVGDMQVMRINVRGVTDRTAIPSVGTNIWLPGQEVEITSAVTLGSITGYRFNGAAWQPTNYLSSTTALPTYAMTGPVRRSGDSTTITLPQLAEVVTTLVADLRAQGRLL